MTTRTIRLRGVEVHNLKHIDLDLPHHKLIVFCGLSGSGKTSLALDTLYAEGQRRYIESFSAYTRQFLERLEKPAAERIDGIPPAVAVANRSPSRSSRSTVGTATETADYLRLLFAKIGTVYCLRCGQPVVRESPESAANSIGQLAPGTRLMIAFSMTAADDMTGAQLAAELRTQGFVRVIVAGRSMTADELASVESGKLGSPLYVVIDRLTAGSSSPTRVRESLETAFARGGGRCQVFIAESGPLTGSEVAIDDAMYRRWSVSDRLVCEDCGIEYPAPEPRLYSFNSPLGACPTCEGFGNISDVDLDLVVPDLNKTIAQGAIAPWTTPTYVSELEKLYDVAPRYGLPLDVPFKELSEEHRQLIVEGVPARKFGGLKGFFARLERKKYKMHVRVFLSRWRGYRTCPDCNGSRLRPEALATRVGGKDIAEWSALKVQDALAFIASLELTDAQLAVGGMLLEQVRARLGYLETVGLGYLTLDRTLRTLSGGEAQRVGLTSALGSSLVNMLYVLDEPSVGLHPQDTDRLIRAIQGLRNRSNTVVVVEHEEALLRVADQLVEIGPGAGERGGRVVFQGTPAEIVQNPTSLTGDYLAGRRGVRAPGKRRVPNHGWIRLAGARGHNLHNVTVEFPLGMLCVVTGVSGSGKSTLIQDTLYPALCRRLRKAGPRPAPFDDVFGDGQIDDCIMVDQSPIGRSPRSNPVTYIKAFDEIRGVFADTAEARMRNFTASYFSFNVAGGRCNQCDGDGYLEVDMQFLADVYMKCPQCQGQRYRQEILDIKYRGLSIADVLEMTIREAFTFFRGQPKVQARLKKLMDVGLDYLRLGQPANTLSGGEAQRLKLAGYLSAAKRGRSLFLLDEPTTGLHFADVVQLLDCFEALVAVGHSLIVVEHNLQLMKSADYIIDLGPGAAEQGGHVVAQGTPEFIVRQPQSITGRFLARALAEEPIERSA